MSRDEVIAHEWEHVRCRYARSRDAMLQLGRRGRLLIGGAVAADDGYPWRNHRSMAEVMRDEEAR